VRRRLEVGARLDIVVRSGRWIGGSPQKLNSVDKTIWRCDLACIYAQNADRPPRILNYLGEDLNASSQSAPSSRAAPVRNASAGGVAGGGGVGGVGGGVFQDALKQIGAEMRLMTSAMMQQQQAAMMQMFQQIQGSMQQQQMAMLQQLLTVLMQMKPQIGFSGRAPADVLPGCTGAHRE
jgi:hypothetical protein